jgi:hypothetical protein
MEGPPILARRGVVRCLSPKKYFITLNMNNMLIVYQPDLSLDNSPIEVFKKAENLALQKNVVVQFKYGGEIHHVNNNRAQKHGEGFRGLDIFPKPTDRIMN